MATDTHAVHHLLEREHELETLSAAAVRAAGGAGGVVLIEGAAGVGKSRLVASARACGRELGMQMLEGRGAVLEREFAFGVVRQLFEGVVTPGAAERRERVFAGAAGLAAALLGDGAAGLTPAPGDASFGALHGLYWLTVNLADEGPVLLAVDDVQWSDRSSLSFLNYLSRRLEGLPVLLVAAGRSPDPEGDELWRQLAEDPVAEVIRPHPLSEAATAEVVRNRLGPDAHDEFCRACHRATRGNPLFLRELVGALADAHVVPTENAAAAVTDIGPSAVSRFVLHRLERIGGSATALARAVAVLGGDVDVGLAAQVAGIEPAEARAVADLLVQADVLAPDQKLGFVHPVVQAAVYEDLMPGERTARHLAVAQLLDEHGAPAERVATHVLQCEPAGEQRWVSVLCSAAEDAAEHGDPQAAVAYLRRALEEPPGEGTRAEVLCELGRWEHANRDVENAQEHLQASLEARGDSEVHARAAAWLSRSAIAFGGPSEARLALDATLAQLETAEGELALELDAEALALAQLELTLRPLAPERLAEFGRRAAGDSRFEPVARIHAAVERMVHGEAAAAVADEIEACLAGGAPADAYALAMAIDALVVTDRYETAARWLDLALEAARAL
ncbi:MAG TPA: AAA family ATPase, partial [Thermoleophilaceae bacterium]